MEISGKVEKSIGDESVEMDDDDGSSEKVSEDFNCCVCLDLLYKPVVLACGHVSCFWCVHQSMSAMRESHCPICRHSYHHFPTICQMLHFLLLKLYPVAYKRREIQILENEKESDCFSPQFEGPECKKETEDEGCMVVDHGNDLHQMVANGTCQKVSVDDALCTFCNQLIYRPVVLNCGHVCCESCIVVQTNETIKCLKCQITHPGRAPKVFLKLDNFLEEQFPTEYALRRSSVQLIKQSCFQQENPSTRSSDDAKEKFHLLASSGEKPLSWWGDNKVHFGAGCDSCGMYPIIGDRYECKDCVEAIGFDLCGDCYNTHSKLPGRFNQQHTPEHRFEITKPNAIRNLMSRLLRDLPSGQNATGDVSENIVSVIPSLSDEARETAETDFFTLSEMDEDEGNHQEDDSM